MLDLPLLAINFEFDVFWQYLRDEDIARGALRTLWISVLAQVLGTGLGVLAAVARHLRIPVASQIASVYIWFLRGTPLLVQLIFWFSAFPQLVSDDFSILFFDVQKEWFLLSPFQAALIGLAINEGAYMAEIVRAGIESIERGQMDAAKSLGMTNLQAMRLVILPQAARVAIPPTGNEFIAMLKNSSLANVIAYPELLYASQRVYTRNFQILELLAVASVWYLALTTVFSFLQAELESRLRPEEERRGLLAIVQRAMAPPDQWYGGLTRPGDRR
jgi:polar amino acid transport system permease protein